MVAYLLRVLMLLMIKPPLNKILLLDEPFSMLSQEYQENMKGLLLKLSETTGIQHIVVTHLPTIAECGDTQYEVSLDAKGYSQVQEME